MFTYCRIEDVCFLYVLVFESTYFCGGRFEGISWNTDETLVAYVAEEPDRPKSTFSGFGYINESTRSKDCGSWKGEGDWEDEWGETYAGKRQPALFVIDINRYVYQTHAFNARQVL